MIDLNHLPKGSILIAPSHLHAQLRDALLKQNSGILGIQIFSLQSYLATLCDDKISTMYSALFTLKEMIRPLTSQFTTYKEIATTSLFLEECYHFIDDIRFWNISIEDLPQDSAAQKELLSILRKFETIRTASDNTCQANQKLEFIQANNIFMIDAYHTLEDQQSIDILLRNGAHLLPTETHQPEKHFFHATNKRQEIEACAQYIIEHKLPAETIHITLADASYKPLLQQIFSRYQIPFTLLHVQQTSIITKRFYSLFNYHLQPTTQHVLDCMDCGLFQTKGYHQLREYIELFNCDMMEPFHHLQAFQDDGHVMDAREIANLKQLEEKASIIQDTLLPTLQALSEPAPYYDFINNVLGIVQASATSLSEKQTFLRIATILQEIHGYVKGKEDIQFLLPFIENITVSSKVNALEGVIVSDLRQDMYERNHHFLLGCTQKNYPAFPIKKGIFDEAYYAKLEGYPSMDKRYQFDLTSLDRMLKTAPYLYASYPLGTYEGKSVEAALEIEQFMEKLSIPYPLHVNFTEVSTPFTITEDTAQQLFLHNGKIHGSVSSVERYVKCPFSYFLHYGLSIREPMKHGFPDSYAGTLFHFMLEVLTTTYGKEYAKVTVDKVEAILHHEINLMEQLFPTMQEKLMNVEERMLTAIMQTLEILDEFEQHSSLHPEKSEYAFTYEIPLQDNIAFEIQGFIDRIDISHDFSCILDYKSSPKILLESQVFAALQLQLLTYAMVVKREFDKDVIGAYYVSLKSENIAHLAGTVSRRKPVTYQPTGKEEMEEKRRRVHRFNGWTLHKDIQAVDDNGNHLVGVNANKDGEVKARKPYDLTEISEALMEIYQIIGTRILKGDIRCTPMEHACTYCSYHEICRFKGICAEKESLIEVGDSIYQKGDEEDA